MTERRFQTQTILLYAGLTVLLFAPNLPDFSTRIFNHPLGNGLKHTRNLWEGMESIAERGYVTSDVTWTNFPDGGKLFTLEAGFQYMGMLFRPFLDVVAIHNLLYMIVIFLAAYSAMCLAREFTGNRSAAVVAGAIYAFAATAIAFPVISGVTETAFLFPLPLVTLFALRSIYRRERSNPVFAALLFILQGLTCWSYGIGAAIIFFLLFVMVGLAGTGRWAEHNRLIRGARLDRGLLVRMVIFVGVVLMVSIPLFILAKSTVSGNAAVYDRPVGIFPGFGTPPDKDSAKVLLSLPSYFMPGSDWLIEEAWLDLLFRSPYMGFLALALAVAGIWRGTRGSRILAAFALLFMVLSFGPVIRFGPGEDAPSIPNVVYGIFWYVFPVFAVGKHGPDRYAIVFQMFLAVVAASGLTYLLVRLRLEGQRAWLLAAGLSLAVLLETMFVSPIPWPLPDADARPHEASLWLRDNGDAGALLDLPGGHAGTLLFRGDIYLQQIYHQRPIAYNILSVSRTVGPNHFYSRVADGAFAPQPDQAKGATCDDAAELGDRGFAYIVYRPQEAAERHREVSTALDTCFGSPQVIGDVWLYPFRNVRRNRRLDPPVHGRFPKVTRPPRRKGGK